MSLVLIGEGGWIIGTHMWHLCGFVTNRGGGMDYRNTYEGLLLIGEGGWIRNTYVAFMWVCY